MNNLVEEINLKIQQIEQKTINQAELNREEMTVLLVASLMEEVSNDGTTDSKK